MKESIHTASEPVQLEVEAVEIRELSWPDAIRLYKELVKLSGPLFSGKKEATLSFENILGLIDQNLELGTWLVLAATGKDQAWLNERSVGEVLTLMAAAAEINVRVIVERLKNGQRRLREVMPQTPNIELGAQRSNKPGSTGTSPT